MHLVVKVVVVMDQSAGGEGKATANTGGGGDF